jgi:hypothetical protein
MMRANFLLGDAIEHDPDEENLNGRSKSAGTLASFQRRLSGAV